MTHIGFQLDRSKFCLYQLILRSKIWLNERGKLEKALVCLEFRNLFIDIGVLMR